MADYSTTFWSVVGIALAVGMLFFAVKLSRMFRGARIARGWRAFALSAIILALTSTISTLQALGLTALPSWWREVSAFIFRLSLIYALYEVYVAWAKLDLTKRS